MHADALISLIPSVAPATPSASGTPAATPEAAAAAEASQPGSFAEALAGLMALGGQAPAFAAPAPAPAGLAAGGPSLVTPAASGVPVQPGLTIPADPAAAAIAPAAPAASALVQMSEQAGDECAIAPLASPTAGAPADTAAAAVPSQPTGRVAEATVSLARAPESAPAALPHAAVAQKSHPVPPAHAPAHGARRKVEGAEPHGQAQAAAPALAATHSSKAPPVPATPATPATPASPAIGQGTGSDGEATRARPLVESSIAGARPETAPRAIPAAPSASASEAALLAASRIRVVVSDAPAQPTPAAVPTAEAPAQAAASLEEILQQSPALNTPAPLRAEPATPPAAASAAKTPAVDTTAAAASEPAKVVASAAAGSGQNTPSSGNGGDQRQATAAPVAATDAADSETASLEQTAFEPLVSEAMRGEAATEARAATQARGAPDTVAQLASQIAKRLDGRSTRFEISLDPAGLGAVQVNVDINARGELSAHMTFERGETASDMRSRAAELQRALEQAGFDLSRGGLSFEQGSGRERGRHEAGRNPARAFETGLQTADAADLGVAGGLHLDRRARSGVNVVI